MTKFLRKKNLSQIKKDRMNNKKKYFGKISRKLSTSSKICRSADNLFLKADSDNVKTSSKDFTAHLQLLIQLSACVSSSSRWSGKIAIVWNCNEALKLW